MQKITSNQPDEDQGFDLDAIFTEPPRPPSPEPSFALYKREHRDNNGDPGSGWETISIRLVGSHPLWAHHLWNAALALASLLDEQQTWYRGRNVLELGAGGGLPSIVTAQNGARQVVVTDYPDAALLDNIRFNVDANISLADKRRVTIKGYIWGQAVVPLLEELPTDSGKFDLIILSDLIFNHSQHTALLTTCENAISNLGNDPTSNSPCVLVFYSHHRPHLAHKDMQFFQSAKERGWTCDEIVTRTFPPMFPEDSGDEIVRSTVHGWKLTRQIQAA